MNIIINIFFFLSLNPYISFLKYNSDIQPISYIFGFCILVLIFNFKKIDTIDIFFAIFAIMTFFYINPNSTIYFSDGYSSANYGYHRRIAVIFAYIIFFLTRHYIKLINPNVIFISLLLNTFFVFLNMVNVELYNNIAQFLIREVKIDFTTYRGPRGYSGLCIEPGYLAGFALTMFSINEYLRYNKKINKKLYFLNIILVFFLIYISKSASGLMYLIIILGYIFIINLHLLKYFIILAILSSPLIGIKNYEKILKGDIPGHNRAIKFANRVFSSTDKFSSFLSEPSSLRRLVPIIVSVNSLQDNIFGSGGGSYPLSAEKYIDKSLAFLNLDEKYYKFYKFNNFEKDYVYAVKNPSAFSLYLSEFGIFFILFLLLIYFNTIRSKNNLLLFCSSFILLLASFSFITSFIWIMIGIINSNMKNDKQKL